MVSVVPLESAAQQTIVDVGRLRGFRAYHTFDSRRSSTGFPDLVLAGPRTLFAEIKRPGEKPRADQVEWLDALASGGSEVYLWTLDDLQEIDGILGKRWDFTPFGLIGRGTHGHWRPSSLWVAGHGRSDA